MAAIYEADISVVAALIGDPTRAAFLSTLMSGRAQAAGELARHAGVSAATASSHLARLLEGGLVTVEKRGRHRYYELAGRHIAVVLEALAQVSPQVPAIGLRQVRAADALRRARSCYDHLAGRAGVALFQAFVDKGWVSGGGVALTEAGSAALLDLDIDAVSLHRRRRRLVRPCADWTERQPHLAGAVGAALLAYMLDHRWFVRIADQPRVLRPTGDGEQGFITTFGIDLAPLSRSTAPDDLINHVGAQVTDLAGAQQLPAR
jgi:DNA-binding transcriptional ArsR family regulator